MQELDRQHNAVKPDSTVMGHRQMPVRGVSLLSTMGSTVQRRLAWITACMMALLLTLGGVALSRLGTLSTSFAGLVAEEAQAKARVFAIASEAEVSGRKLLVLMTASREDRVPAYRDIDIARQSLDSRLQGVDTLRRRFDSSEVISTLTGRIQDYRTHFGQTIDLIEADEPDAARLHLAQFTEPALGRLVQSVQAYANTEQAETAMAASAFLQEIQRDRIRVGLGVVVSLIVGLALTHKVTGSVVRPLTRIRDGAIRLAQGQYGHRVPACPIAELDHVAQALNNLAVAVNEREEARVKAAETETLTQCLRRPAFLREIKTSLPQWMRQGLGAALVCVDVNRLRSVNVLLGFDAGDSVLKAVANQLRGAAGDGAVIGRLSGGAFVLAVPIADEQQSLGVVHAIVTAAEHDALWQGQPLDVALTAGYTVFQPDGAGSVGIDLMLRRAEQAMYQAKRWKVRILRHDPSWEAVHVGHLTLLSDLRLAINGGQLFPMLQPKVDARTGEVCGAEALVRWEHPTRGLVSPGEFIPFAESTGQIRDITRWMLSRVIRILDDLRQSGQPGKIAVNISTLDLSDESFAPWLTQELRAYAIDPAQLQLEVTESGLLAAGPEPVKVLQRISDIGVRLAIDDFGTGQSSLSYLQRLPVHELKIDRSFVGRADTDNKRASLLRFIVSLGHQLGLTVTAEGVETEQELGLLREAGADLLQGFLLSRPLTLAAYLSFPSRSPLIAMPPELIPPSD